MHELHKLAYDEGEHAQTLAALRQARAFELAGDPTRPVGPPASEDEVPYLNFAPLDDAIARLKRAAKAYDQALAEAGRPRAWRSAPRNAASSMACCRAWSRR